MSIVMFIILYIVLLQCIEILGKGCLNAEMMTQLMQILDKQLKSHFERQNERQEKRKDEDYDDVTEEQLMEEVRTLCFTIMTYLLCKLKIHFLNKLFIVGI